MLSGGVDHICQAAFNYGKNVGLAFQVSIIHAPQCRHHKGVGLRTVIFFPEYSITCIHKFLT